MRPSGVIYKAGRSKEHGEYKLSFSAGKKFMYFLGRSVGAGFIGFAVISLIFAFAPIIKEELVYQWNYGILTEEKDVAYYDINSEIDFAEADRISAVQAEAESLGLDSYFSLYIPKIDAKSKIVANVDTSDEVQYSQALMEGVAHARGTFFPGQGNKIFLFSHSTDSPYNISRYNAVFYLLRKLDTGDRIVVYFADEKYEYEVTEKFTTAADDVSWLTPDEAGEKLIMQTCDPPGTTWHRLLVVAEPIII
ncbi:class E sortase [Candidatus Woesebacteria bacterium]|nr:class E sortase [Candidatus Woesebacteria bacterium]